MITQNYLDVPKRLIISTHDNTLALALYALVCRLYLILGTPVPLSRGDAQQFDPTIKDGGFKRAIDRLVTDGWLLPERGYKGTFRPSWGTRRDGAPYPWTIGAPILGAPTYIARDAIRIERALLDLFLGRLIPGRRWSRVERYMTAPLLSLAEVGAYLAGAAGYAIDSDQAKALARWGLWRDGQVQLVPDERVVLAMVSQRATITGVQLTEAGWRRLGWPPTTPEAAPATAPEGRPAPATLIFVPREQVGALIGERAGQPIGCGGNHKPRSASAGADESPLPTAPPTMTGNQSDSNDSRDLLPLPPHATTQTTAGGCLSSNRHNLPTTATARLLAKLGCYPSSIAELCELPVEQVGGVVRYAQSQPNIADKAAWTVDALRRIRDGAWTLPQLATAATAGGRWGAERLAQIAGSHGDLMRLGSDTSDLEPADSAIGGVSNIRALERTKRFQVIGNKRYRVLRQRSDTSIPIGKVSAPQCDLGERSPARHAVDEVPTASDQKVALRTVVTSTQDAPQPSPRARADAEIRAKLGNKRYRVVRRGGRGRIQTGKLYAKRGVLPRQGPNLYAKADGASTPSDQNVALRRNFTSVPVDQRPEPRQKWAMRSNGTETFTGTTAQQTFVTPGARSGDKPHSPPYGPASAALVEPPPQESSGARAYLLSRQLRERLRERCDRSYHAAINRLALQLDAGGQARLVCATLADRATVNGALAHAIATALAELDLPADLAIETQAPPPPARHRWASDPRRAP